MQKKKKTKTKPTTATVAQFSCTQHCALTFGVRSFQFLARLATRGKLGRHVCAAAFAALVLSALRTKRYAFDLVNKLGYARDSGI